MRAHRVDHPDDILTDLHRNTKRRSDPGLIDRREPVTRIGGHVGYRLRSLPLEHPAPNSLALPWLNTFEKLPINMSAQSGHQPVTVRVDLPVGGPRYFNGVVSRLVQGLPVPGS